MPAYKDETTGTWYVKFYCADWTGHRKQIKKRGFETKRDALHYERSYKLQKEGDLDMTFEDFFQLYQEDMEKRLKHNTWLSKEHVVRTKILPYFKDKVMCEISPTDIMKWQNELLEGDKETGKAYSQTYMKTIHNQLSCIFNHAIKYYGMKSNPARLAGNMGKEESKEMQIWTKEEYKAFSEAIMDKPTAYYAFELLYWTGIRCGECLALTMEDFDLEKRTMRINKSYQRLERKDVITSPKTAKSNRVIKLPEFLVEEMEEYFQMLYKFKPTDRIFPYSKSFLHHEMDRGVKKSGVKRIRVHDLRHSHISLLIDEGFSAVDIGSRVGHESQDITFRYAHMFPSRQDDMADRLDLDRKNMDQQDWNDDREDCMEDHIEDHKAADNVIRMEDYYERKESGCKGKMEIRNSRIPDVAGGGKRVGC